MRLQCYPEMQQIFLIRAIIFFYLRMRNKIKISLALFFFFSILVAQEKFEWKRFDISFKYSPDFLKVNSSNDFWLIDAVGEIYHYSDNKLDKIESPAGKLSTLISGFFISPDKIYFIHTSKDWASHLLFYNGKNWEERYATKFPLQDFCGTEDEFFIWGNFGVLLQIKDNEVKEVNTPYKSHTERMLREGENNFVIVTKSDGIWELKGKERKFYFISDENLNFYAKDVNEGKNIFTDRKGNYFEIKNSSFVDCNLSSKKYISSVQNDVGIRSYSYFDSESKKHTVVFPNNIKVRRMKILSNGDILIINYNNEIYLGKVTEKISFSNQAGIYGLRGGSSKITFQAACCDLNNDGFTDITRFEHFINYNFNFLFKERNGRFRSRPNSIFDKENLSKQINFRIFDYNSDGKKDLVTLNIEGNFLHFYFFTKKRNDDFELSGDKIIPLKNPKIIRTNFIPVDFDKDGDTDIMLIEYYGKGNETGEITLLENSLLGNRWSIDNSLASSTRSWNMFAIFADFNDDDLNDIFVFTKWRKNILLYNSENGFSDVTETRLPTSTNDEVRTAGSFDYDNDGVLDLLLFTDQKHFELFENNGKGFFTRAEAKTGLNSLQVNTKIQEASHLSFGDLNNDGFTDFILTVIKGVENKSYVLLNRKGKSFYLGNDEISLNIKHARNTLITDFDGDGDLDIYVSNYGEDNLFVNNLNDENFIKLVLKGSKSNSDGLGAKIRIFDEKNNLIRYHQVGANEFHAEVQKSDIHFGVPQGIYRAEVQFYGGNKVVMNNIHNGESIIVNEESPVEAFFSFLPSKIFMALTDTEVIKYAVSMLFSLLILLVGINYAMKFFNWNTKLAVAFFLINSSILWTILIFTLDSNNQLVKYSLMPLISIAGSLFGFFFSFILGRSFISKDTELKSEDEMLQLLISFSHGEWALRNLNSLQLFFQNFSDENYITPKLSEQLKKRTATFLELTRFNLERIIEITRTANFDFHLFNELKENYTYLLHFVTKLHKSELNKIENPEKTLEASASIENIKNTITEMRYSLFTKLSSDPEKVIRRIVDQYNSDITKNFNLIFVNKLNRPLPVLIKEFELADIIVNLIDNSLEATIGKPERNIYVTLDRLVPRIIIDVTDNGKGIAREKWDEIFERTYSSKRSGGLGLYVSRKLVKKYGGRIFVKSGNPELGTTIRIELTEGKNAS